MTKQTTDDQSGSQSTQSAEQTSQDAVTDANPQDTTTDQGVSQTQAGQETSKSVSFDVDGDVSVIAQPKSMACWATVTSINMLWKNQQTYTIEAAMDSLGSDFRKIFDDNTGLAPDRIQDLSNATGMKVKYQRCETPDSILRLLEAFGPLIIIDDEDPSAKFAVHARIVRGLYGDGDVASTYLKIVDPAGGKTYDESFQDFTSKYEAMADATGWNLQMMHY